MRTVRWMIMVFLIFPLVGKEAYWQEVAGGYERPVDVKPLPELGGMSITDGVYYDGEIEEYAGRYFFADYVLPRIWSIRLSK